MLINLHHESPALGLKTETHVILPNGPGPFPVVYYLHGLSDLPDIWLRQTAIERLACQRGLAVVLPSGYRTMYLDRDFPAAAGERHLLDTMTLVEGLLPCLDRSKRGIGGFSMGGLGSLKLALKHRGMFRCVTAHAGAFVFDARMCNAIPEVPLWFPDGAWPAQDDPQLLATKPGPLPAIHLDVGNNDFLLDANRIMHATLDRLAIAHTYEERSGYYHNWDFCADILPAALDRQRAALA